MKKQLIVIGAICACLLLFGGVFLAFSEGGKESSSDSGGDAEELVKIDSTSLISAKIVNAGGGYNAVWKDGTAQIEGMKEIPLDNSKLRELTNSASTLTSLQKVEDGSERLEDFGLVNPKAEVTIQAKEEEIHISIGNEAPDSETASRYAAYKDDVYVIEESGLSVFLNEQNYFVSQAVTPTTEEISDSVVMSEVTLERAGEEPIHIVLTESERLAGYLMNSYEIRSPFTYPADVGLTEEMFPTFFDIKAAEIAAVNVEEADYGKYDLQKPYMKVTLKYTASEKEQSFTLNISKPDVSGNVFIQRDEIPVIYKCAAGTFTWLTADAKSMVSKEILAPDLRGLAALTIDAGGKHYEIQIKNADEDNEEVLLDGKKAEMESFRNLYYMLIVQSADEVLFDGIPNTNGMEKKAEVTFIYADRSKKADKVVYYGESARKLCVVLNDRERGYRAKASGLETFLQNLEKFAAGETIEARY